MVPAILIYDVGKTNKKLLVFDERYAPLHEENIQLEEIEDDDGFPCENVHALTHWIRESFHRLTKDARFTIKAVNFAAYGASFVYLDQDLKVKLPLYNYLKPYSPDLLEKFYDSYGGKDQFALQTASPVLGNLNSGMQLYRLKHEKPDAFASIKMALHLPQYLSWILSDKFNSDITSIGCHTNLWDFGTNSYHDWVRQENIYDLLAPIMPGSEVAGYAGQNIPVGLGLHDSSAALLPYQACFDQPFILLSTGTWSITLNPFNHSPLTVAELNKDCLSYLSFDGKPVKASRLFAGHEHEVQTKRIAAFFQKPVDYYTTIRFDPSLIQGVGQDANYISNDLSGFKSQRLHSYKSFEIAYHHLLLDIVHQQMHSTRLVLQDGGVQNIYVDGGFSKNEVYMNLLASVFPGINIYSARVPQASATGAALAIRSVWNSRSTVNNLIDLKLYNPTTVFKSITGKNQQR